MKLLIIRPQPGADCTAERARQMGMDAEVIPLFKVQPLPWIVPAASGYDALLLTSANAVRHGGTNLGRLAALPVYAVGEATAKAARSAGFDTIWTGKSGADAIAKRAASDGRTRLLWLAGRYHSRLDAPVGAAVDIRATYDNVTLAAPETLFAICGQWRAVMLHSVRAARHFAAESLRCGADISRITIAALSPQIACAAGLGWAATIVADTPDDEALLSKAKSYFTNKHCDP